MQKVTLPFDVVVAGRNWKLYTFEYKTADGTFSSYMYAISDEHAAAIIEEIKDTAVLLGKIEG